MLFLIQELFNRISTSSYLTSEHYELIRDFSGNIYDAINVLPKERIFMYISYSIVILLIATNMNVGLNHIFAFLVTVIFVYMYIQKDVKEKVLINEDNQLKEKFLNEFLFTHQIFAKFDDDPESALKYPDQPISYLFKSRIIVNFLYDIRDYCIAHPPAYHSVLKNVNDLIKIRVQMENGVINCKEMIISAKEKRNAALNNFQSIIFRIPSTDTSNKLFQTRLKLFGELIEAEYKYIFELCNVDNNTHSLNVRSKPYGLEYGPNANPVNSYNWSPNFDFF